MAFQNYGGYMNQYQQSQQAQIMCVLVPSSAQFNNVTLAPNQKMMVMSQTEPLFQIMTADAMGFVNSKIYSFSDYVSKSEASIEERLTRLEGILYGQSNNANVGKYESAVTNDATGANA